MQRIGWACSRNSEGTNLSALCCLGFPHREASTVFSACSKVVSITNSKLADRDCVDGPDRRASEAHPKELFSLTCHYKCLLSSLSLHDFSPCCLSTTTSCFPVASHRAVRSRGFGQNVNEWPMRGCWLGGERAPTPLSSHRSNPRGCAATLSILIPRHRVYFKTLSCSRGNRCSLRLMLPLKFSYSHFLSFNILIWSLIWFTVSVLVMNCRSTSTSLLID